LRGIATDNEEVWYTPWFLLLQVWADVYTLPVPGCDGKTAAEIFEEAGCTTPAAPSCAACLGGPRDTFARMNEPEVSLRREVVLTQCVVLVLSGQMHVKRR
jgi:hypothetical protein